MVAKFRLFLLKFSSPLEMRRAGVVLTATPSNESNAKVIPPFLKNFFPDALSAPP